MNIGGTEYAMERKTSSYSFVGYGFSYTIADNCTYFGGCDRPSAVRTVPFLQLQPQLKERFAHEFI